MTLEEIRKMPTHRIKIRLKHNTPYSSADKERQAHIRAMLRQVLQERGVKEWT